MAETLRSAQKERTRQKLLVTAHRVFGERGIRDTRMSDIASAAGVAQGTVFVHFPTQDALVEQVIAYYGIQIAERVDALSRSGNLGTVLRAHLDGIGQSEAFYTRLVIENRLLPPGARDALIGVQSTISYHFAEAARREPGVARVAPHLLFNLWIGLVHHYLANGDLFAPGGSVIARHGQTLIDAYLAVLYGKPVSNEDPSPTKGQLQ
jgi:AcrR family transcriptional regulator